MTIPNVFDKLVTGQLIERINKLSPATQPQWGRMTVAQMLAHCNVSYDLIYTDKYPRPNFLMRILLKLFIKPMVVGDRPYKHNLKTAPVFLITDERVFEEEKKKLIDNIDKTQQLGAAYFDNRASSSFGPLSITEWNTMLYKHLDHHLVQFGV